MVKQTHSQDLHKRGANPRILQPTGKCQQAHTQEPLYQAWPQRKSMQVPAARYRSSQVTGTPLAQATVHVRYCFLLLWQTCSDRLNLNKVTNPILFPYLLHQRFHTGGEGRQSVNHFLNHDICQPAYKGEITHFAHLNILI